MSIRSRGGGPRICVHSQSLEEGEGEGGGGTHPGTCL